MSKELRGYGLKRQRGLVPFVYGLAQNRVQLPLRIGDKERSLHMSESIGRTKDSSVRTLPIMVRPYRTNDEGRLVLSEEPWRPMFEAR